MVAGCCIYQTNNTKQITIRRVEILIPFSGDATVTLTDYPLLLYIIVVGHKLLLYIIVVWHILKTVIDRFSKNRAICDILLLARLILRLFWGVAAAY